MTALALTGRTLDTADVHSNVFELHSRSHVLAIDGMRGVAILLVLLFHIFGREGRGIPVVDQIFRMRNAGWVGVDLFFVLSGFLIMGILIDSRSKSGDFRNFYMRRTLRVFPLYYGCLIVAFVVLPAFHPLIPNPFQSVSAEQGWAWLYATNIWGSLKGEYGPGLLGHFWSLAVEEHFYLVWPLLVYYVPVRRLPLLCVGIAVLALLGRTWLVYVRGDLLTAYILTPFRADGLAIGSLCALLLRDARTEPITVQTARVLLIPMGVVLVMMFLRTELLTSNRAVASIGFSAIAIFFACTLVCVVRLPKGCGRQAGVRVRRPPLFRQVQLRAVRVAPVRHVAVDRRREVDRSTCRGNSLPDDRQLVSRDPDLRRVSRRRDVQLALVREAFPEVEALLCLPIATRPRRVVGRDEWIGDGGDRSIA